LYTAANKTTGKGREERYDDKEAEIDGTKLRHRNTQDKKNGETKKDEGEQTKEKKNAPQNKRRENDTQNARRKSKKKSSRPISLFSFPFLPIFFSFFSFTGLSGWPAACARTYLLKFLFVSSVSLFLSSCFACFASSLYHHHD